jgi:HKD family nuclease
VEFLEAVTMTVINRKRDNIGMPDITINAVDKSLEMLLQAEKDFAGYSLDFCSGYVSTDGVLLLKRMLKTAPKARAIVGLNSSNRVSAFQMLRDDCEVEVYVNITSSYTLFHPKIYFGTLNAQAWAMVGSSNLTKSGLSLNIEHNLFITGQRHTEPFMSIEAQLAAFRKQAYIFDADIEKKLEKIEREPGSHDSDMEYKRRLYAYGIKPKARLKFAIPAEAQQVALETLFEFTETTKLEYAYQMLLLLVMLKHSDENGQFLLTEAANYFYEFYRLRQEAGLPSEKSYGSKRAVVDNPNVSPSQMCQMLKISPFPRFERQGLLDMSEDERYFVVNPALLEVLTPASKESLRKKAIERLAEHFGEDEKFIEAIVMEAIG